MSPTHRRRRQVKRKRATGSVAGSAFGCSAVVRLDGDKIRRRAAGALKRARTAYGKAEREWTYFIETEAPAFARWIHVECGPLYARIREAGEKLEYYSHLLHLMEREYFLTRSPRRVCFERAKDRIEHPERYRDEPDWIQADPFTQADDETDHDDLDDAFFLDEEDFDFLGMEDGPLDGDGRSHDLSPWPDPPARPPDDGQLKRLYRQLSRRLHPDANPELSQEQKELWYQVQQAYRDRDAGRLELLLTHANLADGRGMGHATVASLLNLTEEMRHALKTLRSTIRRARQNPAWGFLSWDPARKQALSAEARLDLQEEAEHLEYHLRHIVAEVESWEQAPHPREMDPFSAGGRWDGERNREYAHRPRRRRSPRDRPDADQMRFGFF